jgi:hypothetical protein
MKNTKFLKNQRGNLLVEAMLGIALAGAGFLTYYEIEHHIENRSQFSKVTSNMYQQYNVFLTALEQYAQKSNSTQVVSCQTLKNGYLASNFNCTDYLGDTLEGILVKNQTQTPTAYVVGIPTTNSQNMLNSYNVSSVQVLNQALAQSQPENTPHEFFVVNTNNYIGYPVVNTSQTMSFSTIASYLPQQGLKLGNNSYVISLVDASTLNPSAAPPSCTSSSSVLNPPGTWTYSFTNTNVSVDSSTTTIVTQCSYTEWQPYQYCSYANGTTSVSNNGPPFSTSSCSCVSGSVVFNYVGYPQYFTITPNIVSCANGSLSFTLLGGGGGGGGGEGVGAPGLYGGSGGLTTGVIPINNISSNILTIITAGGGQFIGAWYAPLIYCGPYWVNGSSGCYSYGWWYSDGGGGGGSFVCLGTQCNQNTVLLAAGGGGGGSQMNDPGVGGNGGGGNQNGQPGTSQCAGGGGTLSAGGAGGSGSICAASGTNGMLGAGGGAANNGGISGTPFGPGGFPGGGYGGGGSGGGYYGYGGGGGGGYYGGGGGSGINQPVFWIGAAGGGGSGYCAPIVQSCGGTVGGANNGGYPGLNGGNGQVIISWKRQ